MILHSNLTSCRKMVVLISAVKTMTTAVKQHILPALSINVGNIW